MALKMNLPMLDVPNFAVDWPEWSDRFQVYMSLNYNDHLDNDRKLSIFLYSLGAEGSVHALSLYPQLNSVEGAANTDPFDEIYWRLRESYNVNKDLGRDRDRRRDISTGRRNLMECSPQDIEMDQEKWLLLIPHLSLCELEYMAEAVPRLERIVRNYSRLFEVRIEKCCLEKYPLNTDAEIFRKYESVTSLVLKDLSETAARAVLTFFKGIKKFAMHNMVIFEAIRGCELALADCKIEGTFMDKWMPFSESISGFPKELSELTLIDCKIEGPFMDKWMPFSESTLWRLCLDNVQHSLAFQSKFEFKTLLYDDCPTDPRYSAINLRSLTIKGDNPFDYQKSQLQFISIHGKNMKSLPFDHEHLSHVYINVSDQFLGSFLKDCSTVNVNPRKFNPMEHLWIMSPANPRHKEAIDKLNIKTVVVDYEEIPDPPEEPNLIFDMLNEYCLLEITDYLPTSDWMRFGQLHWKVEMALCSYKYTRALLSEENIRASGIYQDEDHFHHVAQFVTRLSDFKSSHLLAKFTSAKLYRLGLNCLNRGLIDALPEGLEKLYLSYGHPHEGHSYNATFRALKANKLAAYKGLTKFHDLREIEVRNDIPMKDFILLLQQNGNLHRIYMSLRESSSWQMPKDLSQQIEAMQNLTDLSLVECSFMENKSAVNIAQLLGRVGPQLIKLKLTAKIVMSELMPLLRPGCLSNVREFHYESNFERGDIDCVRAIICSMTSLQKLKGTRTTNGNVFDDSDLMFFIQSLPHLVEVDLMAGKYTVRFETELREYLKMSNRQLLFNKTEFP